ncbi:hypothetical protein HAX54_009912 [Datura stramonium]|uniref:Uncharacterized protein n=1 Tax=Datura stramonium TaxID=4076 RepID=A0ABS8RX89_DATST|nr:hypothetical protein [Datura stramonium]
MYDDSSQYDEQKEVVPDAQKISIEESDKDVKKGGTNLKTDVDQFVMIVQKHYKKISDDDDVLKQEIGVEIQKSEIIFLDLKMGDEKEVVPDGQKISIEESDKEMKKGDKDLKTDVDQFVMIDQEHHKEISDDHDLVKQENGVEIQKSEIIFLNSEISDESAIEARDRYRGSVMAIRSMLQRKIDSVIGRSLPFQLISCKTRPNIVESSIGGDCHHFLTDSWANR